MACRSSTSSLLGRLALGGELREARFLRGGRVGLAVLAVLEDRDVGGDGVALAREHRALLLDLAQLRLGLRLAAAQRLDAVLGAHDRGLLGANLVVGGERGRVGLLELLLGGVRLETRALELGLARGEARLRVVGLERQAIDLALLEDDPAAKLEELVRSVVELEVLELAAIGDVALGLGRLALERAEVSLDLRDDVADAQQVLLRHLHLPLGLLLPALELRDAGGLLDEEAAVLRLRADDEADLALLDDRVGLRPDARSEEEVGDVLQADGRLVDQVLAVAVAMEATRDRDVGVVLVFERDVRRVVVLERERDLGEVGRRSRLGAAEDDVLHAAAAEVLRALLAHRPANRVDDVRLAAAVRADDAHDLVVEIDHGPVDERLEAAELETLDLHGPRKTSEEAISEMGISCGEPRVRRTSRGGVALADQLGRVTVGTAKSVRSVTSHTVSVQL